MAPAVALAQAPSQSEAPAGAAAPAGAVPPGYVIGADDVLSVLVWREADLSADVTVRPDGMISLPLVNDLRAAGLTPDQLREQITTAVAKYVADPAVTVVVKAINSRKVFITGQVMKPGQYPLQTGTTVLQLIATAGGLAEYADRENIRVVRMENGRPVAHRFNYNDVSRGRGLLQNIELKPGDTVVVP